MSTLNARNNMSKQFDHKKEEDHAFRIKNKRERKGAVNFSLSCKGEGHHLSYNAITFVMNGDTFKDGSKHGNSSETEDANFGDDKMKESEPSQQDAEPHNPDVISEQTSPSQTETNDKQGKSTKEDHGEPQCDSEPVVAYFSECLFISLICRMTGNANVMDCFLQWKKTRNVREAESPSVNTPMPTKDSVMEWIRWLCVHRRGYDKHVGDVKTKQYKLNTLIARTVGTLGLDILQIAPAFNTTDTESKSPMHGAIPALFRQWAKTGEPNRCSLVTLIARCISNGVGLQMEDSAFFLGHQIVADFESYLPGIAGEVTLDSVHFGHGGKEGIDIIHFNDGALKKNKTSPRQREKRPLKLHNEMVKHFLDSACKDELEAMGLVKMNYEDYTEEMMKNNSVWTHSVWGHLSGKSPFVASPPGVRINKKKETLVWTGSFRSFELTDTEHFLCKLYLICVHSGASRTLTNTPFCGSPFTHPRKPTLLPTDWDIGCKRIGLAKWIAYCKLDEPKRRYSHHLSHCKAEHLSREQLESELTKIKFQKQEGKKSTDTVDTVDTGINVTTESGTNESNTRGGMNLKDLLSKVATGQIEDDDAPEDEDDDNLEAIEGVENDNNDLPEDTAHLDLEEAFEGDDSQIDEAERDLPAILPS